MEFRPKGWRPPHMSRDVRESLTALFAVIAIFGGFWLITGFPDQWTVPGWLRMLLFGLDLVIVIVAWRHVVRNCRRLGRKVGGSAQPSDAP